MTVWVALLRAVNVSGVNRLPMEDFRAVLADLGLEGAKTYIQSGNAVFRSAEAAPALQARIADALHARVGFRPPVLVLSRGELAAALAGCPWRDEPGDKVHFFFVGRDLPRATTEFLASVAAPGERHAWKGRVIWLHLPDGIGRSKLAQRVGALPADVTGRNMKTVAALAAMADRLETP